MAFTTSSVLDTLACSIGFRFLSGKPGRGIAEFDLRTLLSARPKPAETTVTEEFRDKPEVPHAGRRPPMHCIGRRLEPEFLRTDEPLRVRPRPKPNGLCGNRVSFSSELETTSGGHHPGSF